MKPIKYTITALCGCLFFSGLINATTSAKNSNSQTQINNTEGPIQAEQVKDPYEKFNRSAFKLNEKVDKYILKPVATVYSSVIPDPMLKLFDNFFVNITNIPNVINDVLQGNGYTASTDGWRFIINSTVGIGGLFDVAENTGLHQNDIQNFGLTLAKWGYTSTSYFVVPFYGPSTVRDTIGLPADVYLSIYPHLRNLPFELSLLGIRVIDKRADLLSYQKMYDQLSLDSYVFTRNAYLQNRAYLIKRNEEAKNTLMPEEMSKLQKISENYYLDE